MTAALLHDVVDDTRVELGELEDLFGPRVACLVATVTQLSQMNQLMRRKYRKDALSSQMQARLTCVMAPPSVSTVPICTAEFR